MNFLDTLGLAIARATEPYSAEAFLLGVAVLLIVVLFAYRFSLRRTRQRGKIVAVPVTPAKSAEDASVETVAEVIEAEAAAGVHETVAAEEPRVKRESVHVTPTPPAVAPLVPSSAAPAGVALPEAAHASITTGMGKTRASFLSRLKGFFAGRTTVDSESLDDLEEILIASDVGTQCAAALVTEVSGAVQAQCDVTEALLVDLLKRGIRKSLVQVNNTHRIYEPTEPSPVIILVVGVNGVGKTTTVAKLAARYCARNKKVLVVAADTFRAAAVQQVEEWSRRIGFDVIKGPDGAKPASVVFDGMVAAKKGTYDVVLIDTAGRLHTKANLMQELEGVRNAVSRHFPDGPHETVLVVDGVSGQNALSQARQFNEAAALSGVVVTKLDGTPKGGIIIPISQELKVPIFYVGVGEKAADLLPFSADEFVDSLFESHPALEISPATVATGTLGA